MQKNLRPLNPLQLLIISLAGHISELQNSRIAYLEAELAILLKHHLEATGRERVLLTDDERVRLGRLGHELGFAELKKLRTMFKPETVMGWYRKFIAKKYTALMKSLGRPKIPEFVRDLIIRLAQENDRWGGQRIADVAKKLGYSISKSSVLRILKAVGIEPAPDRERKQNWSQNHKATMGSACSGGFHHD